jgi:hypothetical protein
LISWYSLIIDNEIAFAEVHQYGQPPLHVYHEGGTFTTRNIPRGSEDEATMKELNRQIIKAFGLVWGLKHITFTPKTFDGHFFV